MKRKFPALPATTVYDSCISGFLLAGRPSWTRRAVLAARTNHHLTVSLAGRHTFLCTAPSRTREGHRRENRATYRSKKRHPHPVEVVYGFDDSSVFGPCLCLRHWPQDPSGSRRHLCSIEACRFHLLGVGAALSTWLPVLLGGDWGAGFAFFASSSARRFRPCCAWILSG